MAKPKMRTVVNEGPVMVEVEYNGEVYEVYAGWKGEKLYRESKLPADAKLVGGLYWKDEGKPKGKPAKKKK